MTQQEIDARDQIARRFYKAHDEWNKVGAAIAQEAKRLMPGCGKLTHVSGTNGGMMPCGSELTWPDGRVSREFCATCEPNERPA